LLSERIKKLRKALKMDTQRDLSELANLPFSRVQDIERGKVKELKSKEIELLQEKFLINSWWLLTGKGEMFLNNEKSTTSSNNHGYEIDVLNVKAAAGDGIYNYKVEVIDKIVLDKAFFRTAPDIKRIKIIEVDGDSMYPTLQSGDHVIIDETKTNGVDGIYAIQLHGQILIKRLQFNLDGTIDIKSDNIKYDTKAYDPNDTQVPLQVLGMKTLTIQR